MSSEQKVTQPAWHDLRARILLARRIPLLGIVLHDTAGTGTHADTKYLATAPEPKRHVSVDFTAERDGSIWKLNPDLKKYACAHAGRATSFKGYHDGDVTVRTIGIEICQSANLSLKPLYPLPQVKAVARLCAWLCQAFGLSSADITTHRQIITDGSRSDPRQFPFEGPDGFWFHFWEAQGRGAEYLASHGITKVPPAGVRSYVVEAGDSFFAIARELGTTPELLTQVNGLSLSSTILPGQVLKVP